MLSRICAEGEDGLTGGHVSVCDKHARHAARNASVVVARSNRSRGFNVEDLHHLVGNQVQFGAILKMNKAHLIKDDAVCAQRYVLEVVHL